MDKEKAKEQFLEALKSLEAGDVAVLLIEHFDEDELTVISHAIDENL